MLAELCGVLANIGARISSWNGPPNRPRAPAMIWSWTRFCAGFISPAEISR
jgi:hypothetical protein